MIVQDRSGIVHAIAIKKPADILLGMQSSNIENETGEHVLKEEKAAGETHGMQPAPAGFGGNGLFEKAVKAAGWGLIFIGLYFILSNFPIFSSGTVDPKAGLVVVFITGVLTSLHCIGMCGGFVVSYATDSGSKGITPHVCYNGSRLLSYVVLGGLLGLVGSALTFSNQLRSYLSIGAGLFMVVYGLSMFYPPLRRFVTLPGMDVHKHARKSPVLFGLLNSLMPCGPLQAMLIYAAGTGSVVDGALTMAAFGLGTIPLMFLMGTIVSAASLKWMHKIVRFSGTLVIVLGIIMLNRGFLLSGIELSAPVIKPIAIDLTSSGSISPTIAGSGDSGAASLSGTGTAGVGAAFQEINMTVDKYGWNPNYFVVQKGVPVKWNIYVKELTYCNKGIKVPSLGIDYVFQGEGEKKTFEFTPTEAGTIRFTCWMGMLPGRIEVKDSAPNVANAALSGQGESATQSKEGVAVLNIRGMCCQGCANKIQRTVAGMAGVKSARIDFGRSEGVVEYDPNQLTADQIVAKINSLGYNAKLV